VRKAAGWDYSCSAAEGVPKISEDRPNMYLFFVRQFNDIDHFTPIVWKMHKDNHSVTVYCINPKYDIQSDYRLGFLKEKGVKVDYLYNNFDDKFGLLHKVMRFLFQKCYEIEKKLESKDESKLSIFSTMLKNFVRKAGKRIYSLMRSKFYDVNWARDFLEQSGAKALCFDWIRPHKHAVDVLLKVADEMSIPTLSLPHGVFLYTNDSIKSGSRGEIIFEKYDRYDYVVVQNNLFKDVISRDGIDRDKIHVLGSARYCNEWMEQNRKIIPRRMKAEHANGEKLKVVFMTTRPQYRINIERMVKTFDLLSNFAGIEAVIKPHTRTGSEAKIYERVPLSDVSELSSVELCEWADVVLVIASSIIIEALTQNKPALYLKYLHENTTEYEELGACWIIHDENELKDALLSLQKNRRKIPYTDENVNRFFSEIIYGGREEGDVLQDYEEFIVTCAGHLNGLITR
jgi:hypothetical protein